MSKLLLTLLVAMISFSANATSNMIPRPPKLSAEIEDFIKGSDPVKYCTKPIEVQKGYCPKAVDAKRNCK